MNKVIEKKQLSENVFWFKVESPDIAKARKPGQFIILRVRDDGERIPLTIVNSDDNSIELIFQVVGMSTKILAALQVGDNILDLAGPLGMPTHLENFGTCVMVGGGIGVAPLLPITRGLKEKGNKIISVLGARTKDLLILEDEMQGCSDEVNIVTDDGSYGEKGFVTNALEKLCAGEEKIDFVTAIGPVIMMREVCKVTKKYDIKTMVSLNPIMVDGTGMCGGCRCSVKGESKFACVHGPEFDGHDVDFDALMLRLNMYKDKEQESLQDCRP